MNLLVKTILIFALLTSTSFAGIDFDLVDDVLTCGTADIMPESGALSISAWVLVDTIGEGGAGRIIDKGVNADAARVIFLLQNDGTLDDNEQIRFFVDGTTNLNVLSPIASLTFDVWHHVMVTFTGDVTSTSNVVFYIDGVLVANSAGSSAGSLPVDNAGYTIRVGNNNTGVNTFDGIIDELAVWNSILTALDAEHLGKSKVKGMPLQIDTANLKAYWPLDDEEDGSSGDGDTFRDSFGTNHCTGDNGANNTGLVAKAEAVLSYP